jgi:hypothetical protein
MHKDATLARSGAVPRGRIAVLPVRRWCYEVVRRKQAFGILLRMWRENRYLIHRRVDRRALPDSWQPFVWRRPARVRTRIQTRVAALKLHLSLRYAPTLVGRGLQSNITIIDVRGGARSASDRSASTRRRSAAARACGVIGRLRRARPRIAIFGAESTDRRGAPAGRHERAARPSAGLRGMSLRVGIRQVPRDHDRRERVSARARRRSVTRIGGHVVLAPVGMRYSRFAPEDAGLARHSNSKRLRNRARGFRLVPGARPASRFRTASSATTADAPLAAFRRAEQARQVIHGSAAPPPRIFAVPMQAASHPASRAAAVAVPVLRRGPISRPMRPLAAARRTAGQSGAPAARMTHLAQRSRQPAEEVDRELLERNVVHTVRREVSEKLARTVDETVRRQFVGNRLARSALIEQLGSELYDRVVLERERLG